jgi:hypothetical protein
VRRVAQLLAVLLLPTSPALADGPAQWHADGVSRGFQVERRDVPGSHFDELRLSIVSPLSLQRLCDAIYPPVVDTTLEGRFKKRELLREVGNERWTYEQISVPVISNRDYVMHTKLNQAAPTGHCEVTFETTVDASRPPISGFVRLPVVRGHWDLTPTSDGRVNLRYEIFSEPGGGVPAFMARGSQKSTAIDFLQLILSRAGAPATR